MDAVGHLPHRGLKVTAGCALQDDDVVRALPSGRLPGKGQQIVGPRGQVVGRLAHLLPATRFRDDGRDLRVVQGFDQVVHERTVRVTPQRRILLGRGCGAQAAVLDLGQESVPVALQMIAEAAQPQR